MADVFVSYKAEDLRRVKPLVDALEADGYSVWWDARIGGGAAWRDSIEAELERARCVLVAWSKRSVGREGSFVRDEASRAMERGVYLPVKIDSVRPPLGFGERQALPLKGWRGDRSDPRYQAVLDSVTVITGLGDRASPTSPVRKLVLSRRHAIGAAAVASAAVVAGGTGWYFLRPSLADGLESIAVLPFANLSGDPAQDYFSAGMAEEIRSVLARVAGITVAGRISSEAVRDTDAQTVAKKLGVASILSGSVRRSPSTIRVASQLIDGRTGLERWSQTYDRRPGDALQIQSDIAENVAQALVTALGTVQRAVLRIGGTASAAAQELYLRAAQKLRVSDSRETVESAIQLVDAAIQLDPRFAAAYALKSSALNNVYVEQGGSRDYPATFARSAAVARQAIKLAPGLPAAHLALARSLLRQLRLGESLSEFHNVPNLLSDVATLASYAEVLSRVGNHPKAIAVGRRAVALDPLNPEAYARFALVLFFARAYASALSAARKGAELAPDNSLLRAAIGHSLLQMGRYQEALAEYARARPDEIRRLSGEVIALARIGRRGDSDRIAERMHAIYGPDESFIYAETYAMRGEVDRAFEALDQAWRIRHPALYSLRVMPFLDPLRSDPRFNALMTKANFPPPDSE
jgi:TolB-like protein/Flp pilus assembly protein TadD